MPVDQPELPRSGDPLDAGEAAQLEPGREGADQGGRPFEPNRAGTSASYRR